MAADHNIAVCDHFGELDKRQVFQLLDDWVEGDICYEPHPMSKIPLNKSMIVSVSAYLLGCSRQSDNKCLLKSFEVDKSQCLTLNPDNGSLW